MPAVRAAPSPPSTDGRLGHDFGAIAERYDVVVIGSGYGGAVSAARLAEAGLSVCLLERGKEYVKGRFPVGDTDSTGRFPTSGMEILGECQVDWRNWFRLRPMGLYDFRLGSPFDILVGCGLGGGSLINANVSIEPHRDVFEEPLWPDEIRDAHHDDPCAGGYWPAATLDEAPLRADGYRPLSYYFGLARAMLRPRTYPADLPPPARIAAFEASAAVLHGARTRRAEVNVSFEDQPENHCGVRQNACVGCGNCVSGCNFDAKSTLALNYLPLARRFGAQLFTRCEVSHVSRGDQPGDWMVHALHRPEIGEPSPFGVAARAVVVSAGALGSTEILYRSAGRGLAISERIGDRFSSNGDLITFGYDTRVRLDSVATGSHRPAPGHVVGPSIITLADTASTETRAGALTIEDGAFPSGLGLLTRIVLPLLSTVSWSMIGRGFFARMWRTLKDWVGRTEDGALAHTFAFLSIGHDHARGRIVLGRNQRARATWERPMNLPIYAAADDDVKRMTEAIGGVRIRSPLWTQDAGSTLMSVHPLGGCPMGKDEKSGVVDHRGRVFERGAGTGVHGGLYVADGSILATSLGVNPLLTITALAERVAEGACRDLGKPLPCPTRDVRTEKRA